LDTSIFGLRQFNPAFCSVQMICCSAAGSLYGCVAANLANLNVYFKDRLSSFILKILAAIFLEKITGTSDSRFNCASA
jgi:hypothetical protein